MEAKDIRIRDKIYSFLKEQGSVVTSQDIRNKFLEERVNGSAEKIVRRALSSDARFTEIKNGRWSLKPYQGGEQPFINRRYCIFDLETTGGVPPLHRIIEIGAVIVENGELVDSFKSFVSPGRPLPDYIIKLTGIRKEDVEDAPHLYDVLKQFREFAKDSVLVAHGAIFDINFLHYEMMRLLGTGADGDNVCTLKLSKLLVEDSPNHKLDELARYYNLSFEDHHRALEDAKITAHVLVNLLKKLDAEIPGASFEELRKFSVPVHDEHFPDCFVNPELLDVQPDMPGVVQFWGRNSKKLECISYASLKEGLQELYYNEKRGGKRARKLRKACRFEAEQLPCIYFARLRALQWRSSSRDRREHLYVKVMSGRKPACYLTTRRLLDDALYYGPFDIDSSIHKNFSNCFGKKKVSPASFPPKSGIISLHQWSRMEFDAFIAQHNLRSNLDASFILCSRDFDGDCYQLVFVREGFPVKTRRFHVDSHDHTVLNCMSQIFQSYYLDVPLLKLVDKKKLQSLQQYDCVMRWLEQDLQKDKGCCVHFLTTEEIESTDPEVLLPVLKRFQEYFHLYE